MSNDQDQEIRLRDRESSGYDHFYFSSRGPFWSKAQIQSVLLHLHPKTRDRILDAGCGTGIYSLEIAKTPTELFSIDFSSESIKILTEKIKKSNVTNIQCVVGDIAEYEFSKSYFDKAVSIEVIQHIPTHEKRVQALKNIFAALKPGGKLVTVLYRYGGWIKPPHPKEEFNHAGYGLYRYAFTAGDAAEIFTESGFEVEHIGGVLNVPKKIKKRLPASLAFIDYGLSVFSFSKHLGRYLIIVGRKPVETAKG